jgi:predicted Zn-dependent peptidase
LRTFYTMKENIETTRFLNGLTILTEKMPDVRSATISFYFKRGSRHEPKHLNGICHFIEHTVFKGTEKRSPLDIAIETDRLGGNFEAFTSHEETVFSMKVVDKQITQAFDLLADMITNPKFDEKELKREQKVIIEEMKMVEDSPEEFLGEIFFRELFQNQTLALPITGTRKTVRTFNQKVTSDFHQTFFQPHNLIISVAGNLEHQEIVKLAENFFENRKANLETTEILPKTQIFSPILLKQKSELEQVHFLIASPFVSATSEKRYAASLLGSILGGGTSSRLWQKIREEKGLAYSVGASGMTMQDCGLFQIFAATSPENFKQTVDLSIAEMRKIKADGVSETELQIAKDQTLASILLGLEDSSTRAGNLAQSEATHGRQISIDETLQNLEKVTISEIKQIADEFFKTENIALIGLGNFKGLKISREQLEV